MRCLYVGLYNGRQLNIMVQITWFLYYFAVIKLRSGWRDFFIRYCCDFILFYCELKKAPVLETLMQQLNYIIDKHSTD